MSDNAPQTHTFFMLLRTTGAWLALPPKERFAFLDSTVRPLLAAHPAVKMRYFDSEAYAGRFSDVVTWETRDLREYQRIVERLRETPFWGVYFEVREIIPAVENAFAVHYDVPPC